MLAVFTFPIWIFSARTIDRLGKGIRNSARDALLSDESTPQIKGKVFGFHRGMDTLGAAIGPVVALIYLYFYPENYKWLFVIAFAPGLIAVALTLFLKEKRIVTNPKEKNIGFFSFFQYWNQSPKNYKMLVIGLVSFTLFNSSDAFLLLMVKEQGYSDTQMISLYIFYNLAYAILAFPMGHLADKIGMKKVLIFGITIFGIVYLLFGLSSKLTILAMLFGLYALYAASTEGISRAWISNLASKEKTATAIGLFNTLQSIATLVASSLAGLIWFKFGATPVFIISGTVALGVALYLTVFIKEYK
ncbi:MAG TPA: MFS transporter [Tenuifilaceae bacterium]|nr:MFS transporter [Tenuifilaceae bacterium]HPI45148.1 MFS transporter [Tenuifilaceae bacterium]